jgi:hypothetical protein
MQHKQIYIFTHIPKTGGTSLRVHFQKHMIDQQEFIHLATKGHKWAREKGLRRYSERSKESRQQAKVILGHEVDYKTKEHVPDLKPIEIVIFRNPQQWEISRFNQVMNSRHKQNKELYTFKRWLKVEKCHSQFDWFVKNYLKVDIINSPVSYAAKKQILNQALKEFKYVCFTNQLDSFGKYIANILQIPILIKKENVVGIHKINFFKNSDENLQLLENLCKDDNLLYDWIKSQFYKSFEPQLKG